MRKGKVFAARRPLGGKAEFSFQEQGCMPGKTILDASVEFSGFIAETGINFIKEKENKK